MAKIKFLIIIYLGAIVTADLLVTHFGQRALVVTGLFIIPLDLFSRDLLHDFWKGKFLGIKMFLLVCTGSLLSFFINSNSKMVAIASACSFAIVGVVSFIIYQALIERNRAFKMNVTNSIGAVVDSLLFPWIAFGAIDFKISAVQSILKIIGGLFWVSLLTKKKARWNGP